MKKVIFAIALSSIIVSCTRIDAGHEGILVKQYGTDKGVQDVELVTGRVWYNPFTEDVYNFPVFVQTADYDTFSVNAKDGSIFMVDPMVSYHVKTGASPAIFKKYRKDIEEIQNAVILNYTKDAFKNVFNTFTTDSILSRRQDFDNKVTALLSSELEKEGFIIDQIAFGMIYPKSITDAVNSKNAAIQKSQQKQNELQIAKGDSAIMTTRARAEAESNRLRQQTLTPLLIQQQFIEKWNGSTPLYGQSPMLLQNVK